MHLQTQDVWPALKVDLMTALQFARRRNRLVRVGKDAQHAITQHLDNAPWCACNTSEIHCVKRMTVLAARSLPIDSYSEVLPDRSAKPPSR